jgi:peroxin-12
MNNVKEKMQDEFTTNDTKKLIGLYAYRTVKSSYEFAQIIKYISYLSGHSMTHNIPLYLTGIGIRHSTNPIYEAFSFKDMLSGKLKISTILGTLILRCLEFGGFFLQFLQWYQDSSASQKIIAQLPTPDPPEHDHKANKYSNICPICLQTFAIPTTLSISGYVFCFKCIKNHLSKHSYCPVTLYPATIDDLVRIYDS